MGVNEGQGGQGGDVDGVGGGEGESMGGQWGEAEACSLGSC